MSAGRKPFLRFVAESGVIVLGVLVALFMESAWEGLQENALAAQSRGRLAEELEANREVLALDRAFMAENCRASQAAFDGLTGAAPESAEDLVRRLWAGALLNNPRYRRSVYEDLMGAGRLGLIQDPDLRTRIIDYYTYDDVSRWRPQAEDDHRRSVLRELPPVWTTEMAQRCLTLTGYGEAWMTCPVEAELDSEGVRDAIRRIPGIGQQLSERTYRSCNLARFHGEYEVRLNALEEALAAAR